MNEKFKTVLAFAALIIGVLTLILYLATDYMNWNFYGWFSWLMIAIAKVLVGLKD